MSGKLSDRRRLAEDERAEDYAWAIENSAWVRPDWTALNAQVTAEFGRAGLVRIKRKAWALWRDR